jgi:endo-1,4-beta-xylanase
MLGLFAAAGCTVRDSAAANHLVFGTAARSYEVLVDAEYSSVLAREFSMLVPENEMKWEFTEPEPGNFDFRLADRLVEFAQAHGMTVRGTPLLWWFQNPAWLRNGTWTSESLGPIVDRHIATEVAHFDGKVQQWDVVNEAFNEDGSYRSNIFFDALGPEYIDRAFRVARAYDRDVKLYYNDYNLEWSHAKSDAVFAMVSSMKQRGVPIDGVGFQMHALANFPSGASLAEQFARYERIGVDVAITELDVRIPTPPSSADLEAQRRQYHDAVRACVVAPNCDTVLVWGFTDKFSWIPSWFPGYGAATLFDENYERKPAWFGVMDALRVN